MSNIYCDQAATSFPKPPAVSAAILKALNEFSASPGRSGHNFALTASRVVFSARENLAELMGLEDSSRIAFTLNVTQALNVALQGLLKPGDHVLTTSLEHNSVMRPLHLLSQQRAVEVEVVPVPPASAVDPDDFRVRLKTNTRCVIVNHASNVIGTIQPLGAIKEAVGGTPLLVDSAQSAGVLPLNLSGEGLDLVAFTGHKGLLGPSGTGGLCLRPGLDPAPLFAGGTGSRSEHEEQPEFMPDRLEAGTPNVHGLAGLAAGVDFILTTGVENIRRHELELTRTFMDGLSQIKGALVYGPIQPEQRVAVVSLNLKGCSPSDLAAVLDRQYGIMTRPGLHCAPRAHKTIGTFPQGAVRFSFGWYNNKEEISTILKTLDELSRRFIK